MRKLSHFSWAMAAVLLLAGSGIAGAAERENGKGKVLDKEGIERLKHSAGGKARASPPTAAPVSSGGTSTTCRSTAASKPGSSLDRLRKGAREGALFSSPLRRS